MLNTRLEPSHSFNRYSLSTNGLTHTRDYAGLNTLIKGKKRNMCRLHLKVRGKKEEDGENHRKSVWDQIHERGKWDVML